MKRKKVEAEAVRLTRLWAAEQGRLDSAALVAAEPARWRAVVAKVEEVKGLLDRLDIWEAVEEAFWSSRRPVGGCSAPPDGMIFLEAPQVDHWVSWWSGVRGWRCRRSGQRFEAVARRCDAKARAEYVDADTAARFPRLVAQMFLTVR